MVTMPEKVKHTDGWTCPDRNHEGHRDELDGACVGCRIRKLVLADRAYGAQKHDVTRGPCKCGAWH